ncbi:MAG: DUF1501 domain-containing protein, partial [Planctomycetota bacterium]
DFYAAQRTSLAVPLNTLTNTIISPLNTQGRRFALHPALQDVAQLFNNGNVSVLANVGSLVEPMTKESYDNRSGTRPPQLFAHDGQQDQWQLSTADAVSQIGWGGRVADALVAASVAQQSQVGMNISLSGNNIFLSGREIQPYVLSSNGPANLNLFGNGSEKALMRSAYADLMALQQNNAFAARSAMRTAYSEIASRAVTNSDLVRGLLEAPSIVPDAPAGSNLASQLRAIAKMIENSQELGHTRQIFFCAIGGFDNHDGLIGTDANDGNHAARLQDVNNSLKYFWDTLGVLGLRDSVTTFTASDFGRTYRSNGDGSDHGWAGHHFVMGGSQVDGQKVYGSFDDIGIDGSMDTGQGRFIPTTAVDAYSFEIARWLDVPLSEMPVIFPNLHRFLDVNDPATQLGMLA